MEWMLVRLYREGNWEAGRSRKLLANSFARHSEFAIILSSRVGHTDCDRHELLMTTKFCANCHLTLLWIEVPT